MRPQPNREDKVVILGWYENRHIPAMMRIPSKPFQKYGQELCGECYLTNNRSLYVTADAVIINNGPLLSFQKAEDERLRKKDASKRGRSQSEELRPPNLGNETRNSSQYWVFVNYESGIKNIEAQQNLKSFTQEFDSAFNITYSYKRDSDIIRGYGSIQKTMRMYYDENTGEELLSIEEMNEKILKLKNEKTNDLHTGWMISNCDHTPGARLRWSYGQSLIKAGLKLYGEGACFENQTKRSFGDIAKSLKYNNDNFDSVIQFYLSFENKCSRRFDCSRCYGCIFKYPRQIAPPNSFIHAEQFDEAADLVYYLDFLDKNDTAYMEYHDWRSLRPEKIKPVHESHFTLCKSKFWSWSVKC
ncbi:unnamed protein product [Oikopleura dioica]|uniref:Fucosyltransferase n=1 Tax=Oikopleura dioica TaxID=34765 RepID=E4Y8M0_OIKDI|nr:unnamed protein product [Oikopleura dioica]